MTEEIAILERRTPNAEPQLCPQFSIIVPAYNVEKFIAKALDSLINQDISPRNYEIIITDDGSTDQTPAILDSYAEKFPFIRVTHTANCGPSHARNTALTQARGEYITFCDADDFVSPQLISVLTKALEVHGRPDFLVWHHYTSNDFPDGGFPSYDISANNFPEIFFSNAEELCMHTLAETDISGYLWNKAIKRSFALDTYFDEGITLHEDEHYLICILAHRKEAKVIYMNCYLYCYARHPDFGIVNTSRKSLREDELHENISARVKMLDIPDITQNTADLIMGKIYLAAVNELFSAEHKITNHVYRALRCYMQKFYSKYYFSGVFPLHHKLKTFIKHILILSHLTSIVHPLWQNTKSLVKRILVLLHIHKPQR